MQFKPGMIVVFENGMFAWSEVDVSSSEPFLGRNAHIMSRNHVVTIIGVVQLTRKNASVMFVYDHADRSLRWTWAQPFIAKVLAEPC